MTVTAQVKGADGQAVDCPKALVGARFLWDWEDPGLDDGVDSLKKASKDDAYVAAKRDYKPNDAGAPQGGSSNCHVRFGGKRGAGAAPIFPPQSGYAPADQLSRISSRSRSRRPNSAPRRR